MWWVIIRVVNLFLWICWLVVVIKVVLVWGLSVVVCLFNKRMLGCFRVVIKKESVWCWFLDRVLVVVIKWFFSLLFIVVIRVLNLVSWDLRWWKIRWWVWLCFLVNKRFLVIVICGVVFSLGFWKIWVKNLVCFFWERWVMFWLLWSSWLLFVVRLLLIMLKRVDFFVLLVLMIVMKLLGLIVRLIFLRIVVWLVVLWLIIVVMFFSLRIGLVMGGNFF